MKAYTFILLLVSGMNFPVIAHQGKGVVAVSGKLIEAACTIATDDIWQELNFGQISLNEFFTGSGVVKKPLSIKLMNCTLDKNGGGTWHDVSVTFNGNTQAHSRNMFAMTGEGQGVSVKITDAAGNIAIPGQSLPLVELSKDTNSLNFTIHLERDNDQLKPGRLSSFIRFMVSYQ